jgi:hypothetical protein
VNKIDKLNTRILVNRRILNILEEIINKYPDQRFGQLLYNLNIITDAESNYEDGDRAKTIDRDIVFQEPIDTFYNIITSQFFTDYCKEALDEDKA